jgi:hypothetical protein
MYPDSLPIYSAFLSKQYERTFYQIMPTLTLSSTRGMEEEWVMFRIEYLS